MLWRALAALLLVLVAAPLAAAQPLFADRVVETSTTTGTGTINLAGAVTNYRTFVAGIGDGNTTYYCIVHRTAAEWECGIGTVTDASPDTLSRDTLLSSSTGSAVSFSAGTKDVFASATAAWYTQSVLAPSALTANTLPKASGDAATTDSLASDNGTTLEYTGTGGVAAPKFVSNGSGPGLVDLTCGSAPSASGTDHAVLYCNSTSDTLLLSTNGGSYAKVLTNPAALASEVTGTLPVANGGTNLTAASDDNVMVGNGTTWQSKALSSCSASDSALTYNTSTNAFGCNTISGGSGGATYGVVTSDVTHTQSNTTLSNVTGASFSACSASTEVWQIEVQLLLVAANISADWKWGWTVPTGATMAWGSHSAATTEDYFGAQGTGVSPLAIKTESDTLSTGSASNTSGLFFRGFVFCSSTSGTVQLQFAQNTSNASDITVKKGSVLIARKIIN